jgi:very-short-patch-repair endonuclease
VYATFIGPVPRKAWLRAAVLRAGPGAVLSHRTAAELHGLVDPPGEEDDQADRIHVTVPSTRWINIPGLTVHMSNRVAQATQPNREPPRTTVEETVLDLTQVARTFDQVCDWITKACGRGRTTADKLRAALAKRKKVRFRAEIDESLAAAGIGVHSVLEYHYFADVERAHGLPRALRQVQVKLDGKNAYRDVYYEEFRVVVELDGRAAHPPEQKSKDNHRDVVGNTEGIVTCRYDWWDVNKRACETAVLQAKVLRDRGWQGTPVACGPGCPVAAAFPAALSREESVSGQSGRFRRRRRRAGRDRGRLPLSSRGSRASSPSAG